MRKANNIVLTSEEDLRSLVGRGLKVGDEVDIIGRWKFGKRYRQMRFYRMKIQKLY